MQFDPNRMARLAGLSRSSSTLLAETRENISAKLEEIQNQRKRDEQGDEDEHGHQLAEDQKYGGNKGDKSKTAAGEEDYTTKKGDKKKTSGKGRGEKEGDEAYVNEDLDEVVEIDEVAIKREIMQMKQERLAESRLRSAIRSELSDILEEAGYDLDSSWVYGDYDRPKHSKKGQVIMGIAGLGFKK